MWPCDKLSSSSVGVRNDIPASGGVLNTTGRGDDRNAEDKGQIENVNSKERKHDKKIECWSCGGNLLRRKVISKERLL